MSRKKPGDKAKPRRIDQLKHPRAVDRLHGMTQVEELVENLTPVGWKSPSSAAGDGS